MSIRVWANFTGAFEEITDHVVVSGSRIRYIYGTDEYRYAPDVFDFRLRQDSTDLIKTFSNSNNPIPLIVTSDDIAPIYHYQGYVLPDVSSLRITDDDFGDISLSCLDSIEVDLDVPCPDLTYRGETLSFIITDIFSRVDAGYTLVLPSEFDNITIPYIVKELEEDSYIDIVDKLVWEHGYNLYAVYLDVDKRVGFRKWFHNPVQADVLVGNSYDPNVSTSRKLIEPLEINEREIPEKLVSISGSLYNIFIKDTSTFSSGYRLFYEVPPPGSLDPVIKLRVDKPYYPTRGNLEVLYQKYNSTREEDKDKDTKILDAWDHQIGFNIHSRPPIGVRISSTITDISIVDQVLAIPIEEHYSTKSRVVFEYVGGNTSHTIVIDNLPITFGRGIDLAGWEIRGSAVITYGEFTVLDGIDTEADEYNLVSDPTSDFGRFIYILPDVAGVSDVDDFYNGWRVVTENGTNTKVFDYAGATRELTVEPDSRSENDSMGDTVTLISPLKGLKEKKIESEYILVYKGDDDTIIANEMGVDRLRELCEGYKNILEHGKYTYRFKLKISDGIPNIGDICELNYAEFDTASFCICNKVDILPDDIDNPLAAIELKKIGMFDVRRAVLGAASAIPIDTPGSGQAGAPGAAGVDGVSTETIYAESDDDTLVAAQLPSDSWGYKSPGVAGSTQWLVNRPEKEI